MRRVLIANRGEIAVRIASACRNLGLETVAVYSDADAASPHVWLADRAVRVGPAPVLRSYLNVDALLHVAKATGCDAVHPGYGFLAENAGFAERCAEEGLVFVGPLGDVIRLMGDKAKARETAQSLGVAVVPGSERAFMETKEARKAVDGVGFPVLLKARAGGGGKGMRVVREPVAFASAFDQARGEADGAFGDGGIYLERFFEDVRHIEVQVFGDDHGTVRDFGERDCTVQRRHQKLVEETPSPAIDPATRLAICATAVRLAKGIGYRGAGTVEFIYAQDEGAFHFIEMNTRIQVEHPVTEMVRGVDLVELQLRIAGGERLPETSADNAVGGCAMEFRINAEDWRNGFRPAPGRIERWRPPKGEGIRIDGYAYEGLAVTPFYDSLLAKLIVSGRDRAEVLARAARAVEAFECNGVATTLGFHRVLLEHPDFAAGKVHTRWVEDELLNRLN